MSARSWWLAVLAVVGMSAHAQSTPYGGTAVAMPGRVEAEKYDLGGEGAAYHDTDTVNTGGAFRTDGVDLVTCTDTACGQALSDVRNGEWLRYSVTNATTAAYTLNVRVASAIPGGLFHLEVDNVNVTGSITVPNTGSLSTWQTVTKNDVVLTSGSHVLKLVAESNAFSVNWLELTTAQTPYTPGIRTIASTGTSTIEAEAYDQGGSSVAWSDTTAGNQGTMLRSDDVDIVNCDYSGGGTPRCVLANASGEWTEYTVAVTAAGYYTLAFRSGGSGTAGIDLKLDGVAITGSSSAATTPDNFTFTTTTIGKVYLPAGNHVLRLNYNGSGTNPQIDWISFTSAQTAYNGTPAAIPGKVELENYDVGGQGVAYSDNEATNTGGAYRTDGVDLINCTDSGCGTNKWVSDLKKNEWLEYTLDVGYATTYAVSLRGTPLSSGAGPSYGSVTVKFDSSVATLTCDNTTSGSTPRVVQCGTFPLTAGKHRVRVTIGNTEPVNIDYLNIVPVSAAPTSGCGACNSAIPGVIEAENYDTGGAGVGFSGGIDPTASTDSPANGTTIGAIDDTEWLYYTVNATRAGPYDLKLRVASVSGGSLQVLVDGTGVGTTTVPATGSYSSWQTMTVSNVPMSAGTHVVKLIDASGHYYLNWLQFDVTTANDAAPTVSITAPTGGQSFAVGNITLTATATDTDGTISKVEFYNGATLIGTVTSSPYTYTWNATTPGSVTLTAKAYDNTNVTTTSATVTITVNNPPSVSMTAPVNGAKYNGPGTNTVTLTATATDTDGTISKVEFYNGATLIGTVTSSPYTYSWTNVVCASYTLTAKAYDNRNAVTTSAPVSIGCNVPPSVTLISPTASPPSLVAPATINFAATASDSDGTVSKVEFYNGATLLTTVNAAPYTYSWTNVAAGSYTITAKATDNLGATATSTAVTQGVASGLSVSLGSPADMSYDFVHSTVRLAAVPKSTGSTITKVEFYNGTTLLATVTQPPYEYLWTDAALGAYSLSARVFDSSNATAVSAPVSVSIVAPSLPARPDPADTNAPSTFTFSSYGDIAQACNTSSAQTQSTPNEAVGPGVGDIAPGRWWDASRSGQGWDLLWYGAQNSSDTAQQNLFVFWYTYRNETPVGVTPAVWRPIWYVAIGSWDYQNDSQGVPQRIGWKGKLVELDQSLVGNAATFDAASLQLKDLKQVGEIRFATTVVLGGSNAAVGVQWNVNQVNPFDSSQQSVNHTATQCLRSYGSTSGLPTVPPSDSMTSYSGTWQGESAAGWILSEYFYETLEQGAFLSFEKKGGSTPSAVPRWSVSELVRPTSPDPNGEWSAHCSLLPYASGTYDHPLKTATQLCLWESSGYSPESTSTIAGWVPKDKLRQIGGLTRRFDNDPNKTGYLTVAPDPANGSWLTQLQPALNEAPIRKVIGKHWISASSDRSTDRGPDGSPAAGDPWNPGVLFGPTVTQCSVGQDSLTDGKQRGLCDLRLNWATDGNFPQAAVFAHRLNDSYQETGERTLLETKHPYSSFSPPYTRNFINIGSASPIGGGYVAGEAYKFELWSDAGRAQLLATSNVVRSYSFPNGCASDGAPTVTATMPGSANPLTPTGATVNFSGTNAVNFRVRLFDTSVTPQKLLSDVYFTTTHGSLTFESGLFTDFSHTYRAEVTAVACSQTATASVTFTVALPDVADQTYPTNYSPSEKSDGRGANGALYPNSPVMLMDGSAGVSGGAATYDLPLRLPPGRHGMAPALSLSYSSRSGPGIAGLGWNLSGLSSIHRCPQTRDQDNVTLGVTFTMNDRLCLDGQRLVATTTTIGGSPTYGADGTIYRTEVDQYLRVTQIGGDLISQGTWFKVELKSGEIRYYGRNVAPSGGVTPNSKVVPIWKGLGNPRAPLPISWAIDTRLDRAGNVVDYTYANVDSGANGEYLISQIHYTGSIDPTNVNAVVTSGDRVVAFGYRLLDSVDLRSTYQANRLTARTRKLNSITVAVGGAQVRSYMMNTANHGTETSQALTTINSNFSGRLLLRSIQQCEPTGCLPETEFHYAGEDYTPQWSSRRLDFSSSPVRSVSDGLVSYFDDTVVAARSGAVSMTDSVNAIETLQHIVVMKAIGDMDGDGTSEYYVETVDQVGTYFAYLVSYDADRHLKAKLLLNQSGVGVSYSISNDTKGDFNNDGRSDFMGVKFLQKGPTGPWDAVVTITTSPAGMLISDNPATPLSVIELPVHAWTGFMENNKMFLSQSMPHLADINNDGRTDLIIQRVKALNEGAPTWPDSECRMAILVHLNRGSGKNITPDDFKAVPDQFVCVSHKDGNDWRFDELTQISDMDGDGILDFVINHETPNDGDDRTNIAFGKMAGTVATGQPNWTVDVRHTLGDLASGLDVSEYPSYAIRHEWVDVNGDGLPDSVAINCRRPSTLRLNLGGRRFSDAINIDADKPADLVPCTDGPAQGPKDHYSRFGTSIDIDSDGHPDFLVPYAYAARICKILTIETETGSGSGGTPSITYDPVRNDQNPDPAIRMVNSPIPPPPPVPEEVLACPGAIGGSNEPNFEGTSITIPDTSVTKVVDMYKHNLGPWDDSLYKVAPWRLVETTLGKFHWEPSPMPSGEIFVHPRYSTVDDYFGDGLQDILTPPACTDSSTAAGGCYLMTMLANAPDPNYVYGPSSYPDGTPITGNQDPLLVENLGAGHVAGRGAPALPELMTSTRKHGRGSSLNVDSSWDIAPLSSSAGRGAGNVPLYKIPYRTAQNGGYDDDKHFFFASSMPVVAAFSQSNGVNAISMNTRYYSYQEAMYNSAGRGFMGFHKIIEDDTATGLRTTTRFQQKFPRVGLSDCQAISLLTATEQCLGSDPAVATAGTLSLTSTIYAAPSRGGSGNGYYDVVPSSSSALTRDITGSHNLRTISTSSTYDPYGNATDTLVVDVDQVNTTGLPNGFLVRYSDTAAVYANDEASWWLTKLVKSSTGTDRRIQYSGRDSETHPWTNPTFVGTSQLTTFDSATRQPTCSATYEGYRDAEALGGLNDNCSSPGDATWVMSLMTTYGAYGNPEIVTSTGRNPLGSTAADRPIRKVTTGYDVTTYGGYFPTMVQKSGAGAATATVLSTFDKATGAVLSVTDPNGLRTDIQSDSLGREIMRTPPVVGGKAAAPPSYTAYQWCGDNDGRCQSNSNELFRVVKQSPGAPTMITWFDRFGRDVRSQSEAFAAGEQIVTTHSFDAKGQLESDAGPYALSAGSTNTTRRYRYDLLGRMSAKSVATPDSRSFGANGTNYLTTFYSISDFTTAVTVCGTSVPITSVDNSSVACDLSIGKTLGMSRSYDGSGKLIKTVDAKGGATTYDYDPQGNLVAINDVLGKTVSATYNTVGQRLSSNDPDRGAWSYVYDGLGELLQQTDARGRIPANAPNWTTTYTYDGLGRRTGRSWSEQETVDGGSQLPTHTYADIWRWDMDHVGTLSNSERVQDGNVVISHTDYHYDSLIRVDQTTDTIRGIGLPSGGDTATYTTATAFDSSYGRVKSISYPGTVRSYLTYNDRGFPVETGLVGGAALSTVVSMDAKGRVTERRLGNHLVEKQRYEAGLGQLLETCVQADTDSSLCNRAATDTAAGLNLASGKVGDFAYRYDLYGNALEQRSMGSQDASVTVGNVTPALFETFTYDELHRMTTATRSNGSGQPASVTVSYSYDAIGNFLKKSDFSQDVDGAYHYDDLAHGHAVSKVVLPASTPQHEVAVTYGYDANGNMVTSTSADPSVLSTRIDYNGNNQPNRISNVQGANNDRFRYNESDARIYQRQFTGSTKHIFTVGGLEETFDGDVLSGANVNSIKRYSLPGGVLYLVRSIPATGSDLPTGVYFRHSDRLGSAVFTTNDSGIVVERRGFDAFGKARDPNWSTEHNGGKLKSQVDNHGFTGQEHLDNVQLIHMNGRVYDYNLGRFLGVDPLIQFPTNSQSLNPYSYVMNNPLAGTDPTGYGCAASQIASQCDKEASGASMPTGYGNVKNFVQPAAPKSRPNSSNGSTGNPQPTNPSGSVHNGIDHVGSATQTQTDTMSVMSDRDLDPETRAMKNKVPPSVLKMCMGAHLEEHCKGHNNAAGVKTAARTGTAQGDDLDPSFVNPSVTERATNGDNGVVNITLPVSGDISKDEADEAARGWTGNGQQINLKLDSGGGDDPIHFTNLNTREMADTNCISPCWLAWYVHGNTIMEKNEIQINSDAKGFDRIKAIMHEVGHILVGIGHPKTDSDFLGKGVMRYGPGYGVPNADDRKHVQQQYGK